MTWAVCLCVSVCSSRTPVAERRPHRLKKFLLNSSYMCVDENSTAVCLETFTMQEFRHVRQEWSPTCCTSWGWSTKGREWWWCRRRWRRSSPRSLWRNNWSVDMLCTFASYTSDISSAVWFVYPAGTRLSSAAESKYTLTHTGKNT